MSRRRAPFFLFAVCILIGCALLSAAPAAAQSSSQISEDLYVPPSLQEWVPWVLHEHPEMPCAERAGEMWCAWPGELALTINATEGSFSLRVTTLSEAAVTLPGSTHWPRNVRVNGADVVVYADGEGHPVVHLPAGDHLVTGQFTWKKAPEVLHMPTSIGAVALTTMGRAIERPRRDDRERLWIREGGEQAAGEADAIRLSVYRKIADGVPMRVTTMLELNVAGRAREVSLGEVLLPHAHPVDVRSSLPLKIGADGMVKAYVRPGTHRLEIDGFVTEPVEALEVPPRPKPFYDDHEVWVWQPDETLRSVELSGLLTIDPSRTTLPSQWHGETTLLAKPEQTLSLNTTRRGEAQTPPNRISLRREIWLDLDGQGYTIKDSLTGTLHRDWRLNYGADAGELGRVTLSGEEGDSLLITKDVDDTHLDGVELRSSNLAMNAEVRLPEARDEIPAVGWEHDVQSLEAGVHLPPGWTVLAAQGVDDLDGTWVGSWDLFEFFVLLMIAFSMGKLFGWPWGVLAAIAMILSHGQSGAPRYVWFHLVAIIALLRVLPDKPIARIPALTYLAISFVVMASSLGMYAHEQIREGFDPQSGYPEHRRSFQSNAVTFGATDKVAQTSEPEMNRAQMRDAYEDEYGGLGLTSSSYGRGSKKFKQPVQQQIDPNEVVQTGFGLPTWEWNTWRLRWSGPVAKDHTVRLWLISPMWHMALKLLSVLVFVLMALVVIAPSRLARSGPLSKSTQASEDRPFDILHWLQRLVKPGTSALIGGVVFAGLSGPMPAAAQQSAPDTALLSELETRLTQHAGCEGPCVIVPSMTLVLDEDVVTMRATVHAQRDSSWLLPGPASIATLSSVRLDGLPTTKLRREPGGMVAAFVPEGVHVLEMRAALQASNIVTLQLDPASLPKHVDVEATGWDVDGLDEYGHPNDSLQLSRRVDRDAADDEVAQLGGAAELPPYYFVERTLLLSMPWQVRTVVRRERTETPQMLKVPLLDGEAVISEGVRVDEGRAQVSFERGVEVVSFLSELTIPNDTEGDAATLTLTSPSDVPYSEIWRMECSRIWRCTYEGINPVATVVDDTFAPVWKPWPGESVAISVRKPKGTQGASSTVTRVDYTVTPGQRRLQATLELDVRASQGGWQRVTLPEGAQLQQATIDGEGRNIRPEDGGVVALPIKPGSQTFSLQWMQPWERSMVESFPGVDIGSKAVNAKMHLELGGDRWLLWTFGPSWGPAVLFWSHLAILILLGVLLGRLTHLPLRTHHWVLLVIGMSQLPIIAVFPIVVWFTMLIWRKRRPPERWWHFNLFQLALIGATLLALGILYAAVHTNLLLSVDMQVSGMNSSNHSLTWYIDRVDGQLPRAGSLTVPLLVWRGAMLLWALWLVANLVKWLPWAWNCFSAEGVFFKRRHTHSDEFSVDADEAAVVEGARARPDTSAADGTPGGVPSAATEPEVSAEEE